MKNSRTAIGHGPKAIETSYKGYKFRSRLEARWAVYFDVLGIKWEYEPEGFDLGELGWYLPDFWLPEMRMWAEVKADAFTQDERDKLLCLTRMTLTSYRGGCLGGLILDGMPELRWYEDVLDEDEHGHHFGSGNFFEGRWHGLVNSPYHNEKVPYTRDEYYIGDLELEEVVSFWKPERRSKILSAIHSARSARFEHGETPVV